MFTSVASRPRGPAHPAKVGTAGRSLNDKLADIISPKDFGAVGDGITNDAPALQAALTYCQTTGKILYLGPGRFRILAALSITAPVNIIGAGSDNTSIELGTVTMDGIAINSNNGCTLSDFQILGANNGTISLATAGSLITVTGPSVDQISTLRDLRLIFGSTYVTFGQPKSGR